MKWLIVEDALRDRKGHWLEYVSTFVRGLTALGDEVVVLCDRRAEGFILEQMVARPVLPESIWHRMGDGAGALKRYLRVPAHAIATFFAMRKYFRSFDHRGHREHRAGVEEVSHGGAENGLQRTDVSKHVPCSATETEPKEPATRHQLPATSNPPDWIFVPTVLVHHLLGWSLLIKAGSVPAGSRVLLFFPNLPIRLDNEGKASWNGGPTTKLMAWLFAQLRKEVGSGRVVLGVETHAMRRALESLIRMRVVYLPHPVEFHAETRRRGGAEILTTEDTESTIEHWGKCEMEQPKVGPKGEEAGATESKAEPAQRLGSQAGAKFSNPSTSKLAHDCENTSLNRTTIGSASALDSRRSTLDSKTSAEPIVFGCYGAARWEKGSDVFLEAIKLILKNEVASEKWRVASGENQFLPDTSYPILVTAAGSPLRFVIQWVDDFQDAEGNWVRLDPCLKNHPQVEVIDRYFQGDEYQQRLAETDVMVLPYRSPYQLRVSRVVIEAMMFGMPAVATKGTTLFQQAEEHGVVVGCEEGSAESLAEAILKMTDKFDAMRESAVHKAVNVAESFSVGSFREEIVNNI